MSDYSSVEIDKRKLFDLWKQSNGSEADKVRLLGQEVYTAYNIDESYLNGFDMERALLPICKYFTKMYRKFHRCEKKMMNCHIQYFQKPFKLPSDILANIPGTSRGRPPLNFRDSSNIIKRRKTANLRRHNSVSKLAYATQMKLRESGAVNASNVVKEATMTTPTRATKMLISWRNSQQNQPELYSDLDALALLIDANLTKSQYLNIQKQAKLRNVNIYPSYNKIVIAKKQCYPEDQFIKVDDMNAEVNLQKLLDHTSSRIALVNKSHLDNFSDDELTVRLLVVCALWFNLVEVLFSFMEYFLHVSYRLDIKKWQVKGKHCEDMKIRKNEIQRRFKLETGLNIDKPRPGGSGSSNDGNTARRFFFLMSIKQQQAPGWILPRLKDVLQF